MHASPPPHRSPRLLACLLLASSLAVACGTETPADTAPTAKQVDFLAQYSVKAEFPEGGVYDKLAGVFYVGSLKDGSVHKIDAVTGEDTEVFRESAAGTWWTLGMDVDLERSRLWVCAMDDRSPSPRAGFVWVIDTKTGERVATHDLSTAAKDATCTDVAVAKDGSAYVVDREQPHVYRVELDGAPKLFASDPALKGGAIAGMNAAAVLPDQSALLTVIYGPPSLVRVDLGDASVQAVAITGTFADDKSLLAGADGLALADGAAHVAFSGKLVTVTPESDAWASGTATEKEVPEGMTDVVATPGGLYLLNGQAVRFALKQDTDPFVLRRVE